MTTIPTVKVTTCYETSDGKLFKRNAEARYHQAFINFESAWKNLFCSRVLNALENDYFDLGVDVNIEDIIKLGKYAEAILITKKELEGE